MDEDTGRSPISARKLFWLAPILAALVVGGAGQAWSVHAQAARYRRGLAEKAQVVAALLDKSPELPRTRELLRTLVASTGASAQPMEAFIVAGAENVRSSARPEEDGRDWSAVRARVARAWPGMSLIRCDLYRDPSAPARKTGWLYVVAPAATAASPLGAAAAGLVAAVLCFGVLLPVRRQAPPPVARAEAPALPPAPALELPTLPLDLELTIEVGAEVLPALEAAVAALEEAAAADAEEAAAAEEEPTAVLDDAATVERAREPLQALDLSFLEPVMVLVETPASGSPDLEPTVVLAETPGPAERRRHPRFECAFRVRYRFARESELFHGGGEMDALNMSVGGLKVRLEHALAVNDVLHLELQLPDGPLNAQCRVAWSQPEEHVAGLEFLCLADEDCSRLFAALDPALCA